MTTTTTAADLIARRLYEAGCRQAFGIPGGEVLTMMNALRAAGVEFHLAKHENAAGFMAEGTHHVSGAPGILLATIRPGAANAVNVTANAWQDRVPLIVLTGCVDEDEALTYTHQVFDHREIFRPITKASFRLGSGGAATLADKAVALALDPRPGPVHIDLPISDAARAVDEADATRWRTSHGAIRCRSSPAARPRAYWRRTIPWPSAVPAFRRRPTRNCCRWSATPI